MDGAECFFGEDTVRLFGEGEDFFGEGVLARDFFAGDANADSGSAVERFFCGVRCTTMN